MTEIRCSSTLHTALGLHALGKTPSRQPGPSRLGNWAAVLSGQTFAVAIEERTCLTLILRLRPVAGFRKRFTEALRQALLACGVSAEAVRTECDAIRAAQFVRRRHPKLADALEFAEEEGVTHAELGQSEASVQNMLNDFPYGECPAACPKEAVGLLFGRTRASGRRRGKAGM